MSITGLFSSPMSLSIAAMSISVNLMLSWSSATHNSSFNPDSVIIPSLVI